MKKFLLFLCMICFVLSGNAQASTIVLDASKASLAQSSAISTTDSNSVIGTGAWQANGAAKSSYWFDISSLGSVVRVSDLSKLSFSTNKSTTGGSATDWYLTIYTTHDGVNDSSSWYGRRLTAEGLYANNFSNPANNWNTWSTDSGTNQLTFLDSNTTNFGFYTGPTLTDIQNGDLNWESYPTSSSTATINYANEIIYGIVLETGSLWAPNFTGLVDNVVIATAQNTLTFDLESSATAPIPEPATMLLFGLGLLGMAGVSRRKN